ncbi:MarR family winged helix-turn-helix transcriptional regulator [Enterococcus sp. CWB-B31]|uniref:MarR family winged helix-turn-helix transcriptional regulator n=1 Tax=Enterococcus sp. CWB-B31 TaxID=2885159 RepID=UPI001E453B8B|nr:transcriptional regulator [Enterococcus sp. CWB-B31]MCB5953925.1 transcriptional regulator [Enterococcus sp. CWB-B31]
MSFAEEAEKELVQLMIQNRDGAFSRFEKSNRGENIVIKFLDIQGEPISPKYLADSLNLSSARIAAVLGSLEKKGQITRHMDPKDRRRINVTLTACGKKAVNAEKREMRERIIWVFNQMGEEDTKKFIELTSKFIGYSQKFSMEEEGD